MKLTINTKLEQQPLFNYEADDSDTSVVGAKNTNLNNLSNIQYPFAVSLYEKMRQNYWTPEIVPMGDDDLTTLTPAEFLAAKRELGFLVYLDSLQTINLPIIADFITNAEVRGCLLEQGSQEFLHSKSYENIFTSLFNPAETEEIYYMFRKDETLLGRTKHITGLYQAFADDKTLVNFIDTLIANLLLEGLYFYMGFNFFYSLANNNRKVMGTVGTIKLIQRDELTHKTLFQGIINSIIQNSDAELQEYIRARVTILSEQALEQEFKWSQHVLGDIPGFTDTDMKNYLDHLLEGILKPLGCGLNKPTINPYRHLNRLANEGGGTDLKSNFFESSTNDYAQVSAIRGFREY